jgi:hypothetical protein
VDLDGVQPRLTHTKGRGDETAHDLSDLTDGELAWHVAAAALARNGRRSDRLHAGDTGVGLAPAVRELD